MNLVYFAKLRASLPIGRSTLFAFLCIFALSSSVPREARASTIDLSSFTLLDSTFANGAAVSPDAGWSVVLTGPNDGSGEAGTADLVTMLETSGTFQFDYLYSSQDDQGFDYGGYLIDGTFHLLADLNGQSGTVIVPLSAHTIVGFRIGTVDNLGEPGIMTISNFNSPASEPVPQTIPEAGSFWLTSLALFGGCAVKLRRKSFRLKPMPMKPLVALAATVFLAHSLTAQQQVQYTGINVTGSLAKTGSVNFTVQIQPTWLSGLRSTIPETTPKAPPKFLKAPASTLSGIVPALVPSGRSLTVGAGAGLLGFNALSHLDQRLANNGNQFSIEPPSQSIAANTSYILEGVNDAVQVFYPTGQPALPAVLSSNQVFGLAPSIDRNSGVNGVYLTDMRVYFDPGIDRWFVIQRALDNDIFGNPLNTSHLYIAVSQTDDPRADYTIYVMDTTNANHPGCPCIADYPQVGSDQYGLHIAWNEFTTATNPRFVDASILSLSKASLAAGAATPTAFQFFLPFTTGYEFAIQPATTPPGASNFIASGGLAYFVSTYSQGSSAAVALWAMTNTSSLAFSPNPILTRVLVPTLSYTTPDVASQRPGPLPYGSTLSPPGQLPYLDGGDARVQALSYASGRLYFTLPTAVADENGRYAIGGAYVVLSPTYRSGVLAAKSIQQGYLLVNGNYLLRPAIAVNAQGSGAIAATLVGPDWYPSAVVIPFDTFTTPLNLQISGAGTLPEDGFTGYPDGGGMGVARWGDYNSAFAASDGKIWMVAQYIGSYPRTDFANWNTYIVRK